MHNFNISKKTLSNGMPCVVVKKRGYKEKRAMIVFGYGSTAVDFCIDGKNIRHPIGTAHFLEHKMFESKEGDMFSEFSKYGASANAYTNFDSTAYYFGCVDNFEKNLSLLCDMVSSFYVTDESVEREKSIITNEICMYGDDADRKSYFNLLKALYPQNAVANEIAGYENTIALIDKKILEEAYNCFCTADNAMLIVVGNVDENSVFETAENKISLKSKCDGLKRANDYKMSDIKNHCITESMSVSIPVFNAGFRLLGGSVTHRCAVDILSEILFGKSSRLFERLYNEGIMDFPPVCSYFNSNGVSAMIVNGQAFECEKIKACLFDEIKHYDAYGISDEIFDTMRAKMRFSFERNFDNIGNICMTVADCFINNTEMLDIFEKYAKIDIDDIYAQLSQLKYENFVLSTVCANKQGG
jgi:predicted Zn-dependent peptidase